MLDDREDTPGDLVHDGNEAQWRQKFCDETGHSMECVGETVTGMAEIAAAAANAADAELYLEDIINQMGVELFEKHLRNILAAKDCECNK